MHFKLISVWPEMRVYVNSFYACAYPIVPAQIVEKTILSSIESPWHLCQKSIDHKCKARLLDPKFCSITYIPFFKAKPHLLNYRSFILFWNIVMYTLLSSFCSIPMCILGSACPFLHKNLTLDLGGIVWHLWMDLRRTLLWQYCIFRSIDMKYLSIYLGLLCLSVIF